MGLRGEFLPPRRKERKERKEGERTQEERS
jgi:hypothetical protein